MGQLAAAAARPVIVACPECRNGDHGLCTSSSCRCPDARRHRNRPGYGVVAPAANGSGPASNGTPAGAPTGKAVAHWELVEADPPAKTLPLSRVSSVERARPLLEEIMASGSRAWHRIALFPSPLAAGQVARRLRRRYPANEWEWQAVSLKEVGQSGLYVRRTGEAGLL